ncbi:acetoin dehydrogenase dihydrolipoyllysine-residue acetyltransferase subunit [Limimaricola cinnabarinus]|uniref:Dihydrolipoamide acetyltransferase component of pyruvate dehydrogenase complex n=1 Tax=Limimaricola cinnabarinus LL-001 TaxID=1337093 RepID=U2Z2Q2_9RHOB|nr:acetoin dehydrogenase dihydrolipoyllysine-residue acetyltransferase subunit [Limimaricola cinnabarinus]GAD55322.1 dihydrolipoamide acetyltransferase component of pyruvate dehydrogenase complex [Limimaricola cinnabarinus LL-001]
MATEVILPKVDMDMESGLVSVWHVAAGSSVSKGDALFDIETDKAAMEIEAPASGILAHVIAPEGTKVPVGSAVAWIYAENETIPEAAPGEAAQATDVAAPPAAAPGATCTKVAEAAEPRPADTRPEQPSGSVETDEPRPRATPAARAAARTAGLDLARLVGSGPQGRIQSDDVAREIEARERPAPAVETPSRQPAPEAPAAPVSWTERPGALAVTRRKGQGSGAPVVLVHGFAADATGWAPMEKALGNAREIIRIDLACHGRSPLKRIESFAAFARLAVQAFDDLNLDGAHLVGHSLGGAVAMSIADIRPRAMRSLGLIAPAGLGPEIDGETLLGIARASRAESLAPWLKRLAADPEAISWDFAQAAMLSRMDEEMRAAQRDLADRLFPDGTQGFDLSAALGRVEVPLRVIWGKQDSILPWRHALRAPDHASLTLLDKVGHIPHIERPQACAKALGELFVIAEASSRG